MNRVYAGARFGRLLAIKDTGKKRGTNHVWLCQCECGNFCEVSTGALGISTNSCGCFKLESHRTHNESKTRLYRIWTNMKKRCDKPNVPHYKNYGGRGITYCKEWSRYEPFREWALSHGYTDELTLDRIDVDGNYCPDNCRFATLSQQANNRRVYGEVPYHGIVKIGKGYMGQVTVNGKRIHCGYSKDLKAAVELRNQYIDDHNLQHKKNVWKGEHVGRNIS